MVCQSIITVIKSVASSRSNKEFKLRLFCHPFRYPSVWRFELGGWSRFGWGRPWVVVESFREDEEVEPCAANWTLVSGFRLHLWWIAVNEFLNEVWNEQWLNSHWNLPPNITSIVARVIQASVWLSKTDLRSVVRGQRSKKHMLLRSRDCSGISSRSWWFTVLTEMSCADMFKHQDHGFSLTWTWVLIRFQNADPEQASTIKVSHKVLTTGLKTFRVKATSTQHESRVEQDSLTMRSGLTELSSASCQHGAFRDRWLLRSRSSPSFTLQSCCQTLPRVVRKGSQNSRKFSFCFLNCLETGVPPTGSEPESPPWWKATLHLFSPLTTGLKRRPSLTVF